MIIARTIAFLLATLVATAHSAGLNFWPAASQLQRLEELQRLAAQLEQAPRIDKEEATAIAMEYFLWKISRCGNAGDAIDAGDEWHFRPFVGAGGERSHLLVRVGKDTGFIFRQHESPVAARDVIAQAIASQQKRVLEEWERRNER